MFSKGMDFLTWVNIRFNSPKRGIPRNGFHQYHVPSVAAWSRGGRAHRHHILVPQNMTTQWTKINQNEALKHPLYGVRGWLLVFAIGCCIGPLMSWGQVNSVALQNNITISQLLDVDAPEVSFLKVVLYLELIWSGVVIFLLFTKNSSFRTFTVFSKLAFWPLLALCALNFGLAETGNSLARTFVPWIFSCAIWVTYLQRSERVRVTFERSVRTGRSNQVSDVTHANGCESPVSSSLPKGELEESKDPEPFLRDKNDPDLKSNLDVESGNLERRGKIGNFDRRDAGVPQPDEDSIYAIVADELESGKTDKGLWTRLFADCSGDEKQTKVLYIKRRFEKLMEAERIRRVHIAQVESDRIRKAEADAKKSEQLRRREAGLAIPELIVAVSNGNWSKARDILNAGSHPFGFDENGTNLLDIARGNGDQLMIDLIQTWQADLLGVVAGDAFGHWQSGAVLSNDEVSSLIESCVKFVELVQMADKTAGYTLLHWCARLGMDKEAKALIELGADATAKNIDGKQAHQLSRGTALYKYLEAAARKHASV